MSLFEQAKHIVCGVIAVALAMSVATIEALLPSRPDWLERINQLALQLKYMPRGDEPKKTATSSNSAESTAATADGPVTPEMDPEQLLRAYNQLWQCAHAVRSDGLALDDKFCERIEKEWTVPKLLSFVRSADRSLQDRAENTLESASTYLAAASISTQNPS